MNRLWAPWRKAYIRPEYRHPKGCIFCRIRKSRRPAHAYVLKATPFSFAVLNLYPYNNGHTLICPNRHVAAVSDLTDAEQLDWLRLYEEVRIAMAKALKPHGFNVGMNVGRVSGAGIPAHLHLHVVPRWQGDVNFMPVLAHTKVISESLESVYRELVRVLKPRIRSRTSRERGRRTPRARRRPRGR